MREDGINHRYDVVMLGTFAAWRLGTLQARALPLGRELVARGVRVAMVTSPWDMPHEAGVTDVIDGVPLYNTRAGGATATPWIVRDQVRLVQSLRPRVVHLFKPRGFGGLSALALRRSLPIIVDSDDWEGDGGWNQANHYSLPQRRLFDWQERTLLRDAVAVTTASTLLEVRARTLRRGAARNRVWRVPNGIDVAWFNDLASARNNDGENGAARSIVLYSRMREFPDDWVPRFAAVLTHLLQARPDRQPLRIAVIGTSGCGWNRDGVCVERLGYVARRMVPAHLVQSSIAVYPYSDSLITRAKQSVKLLELMAAGCAVVASDVGDVPATLGDCGVLVPDSAPEAFAEHVALLLERPDIARRMGHAAMERVRTAFLTPTIAEQLYGVYHDLGVVE